MAKKKEKIRYIDDGRTIADMSNVRSGPRLSNPNRPSPKFKDVWKTYWGAVKMMLVPMLVVIGVMCVVYLLFYFLLYYFA